MSSRRPASPSNVKNTVRRKTEVSKGRRPKLCLNFLTVVVKCDAIFFDTKRQPRPFACYIRHSEFKNSFRPCIVCINQADCGVFCERSTSNLEPQNGTSCAIIRQNSKKYSVISAFWAKCYSDGEFFKELLGENVAGKPSHIRYGPEVKGRFCVRSLGERHSKRKWLSYRSKQIDVRETAVGGPCNELKWIVNIQGKRASNIRNQTIEIPSIQATACSIRFCTVAQLH